MLRFACFPPIERQRRRKKEREKEMKRLHTVKNLFVGVKRISLSMLETFTRGVAEKNINGS